MSLLNQTLIILFSISFFNGLFLSINKTYLLYKNRFLGVALMIYSLFLLSYVWWFEEKFILEAPYLLRTVNPLMFLTMPFFYFFVRNTLSGENRLKPIDFLHFIPALIHIIELTPLYFMPAQEKYTLVSEIVKNPKSLDSLAVGFIPGVWVDRVRLLLQIIYYGMAIRLIFRKSALHVWGDQARFMQNWLLISALLFGMLLFAHILYTIKDELEYNFYNVPRWIDYVTYVLFMLPLIFLNTYIRISPDAIYGFKRSAEKFDFDFASIVGNTTIIKRIADKKNSVTYSSKLNIEELDQRIEKLFVEDKIFLDPELNLYLIAQKLDVSERIVSQFIKNKYDKGLKEFINQYRIQEAIQLMESGHLEQLSMEGLCFSVGFKSRITFFNAFKKEKGCSPSQYVKDFKGSAV